MSDKIGDVVQAQVETFVKQVRAATGADSAAVILEFNSESCIGVDLRERSREGTANLLRGVVVGASSILGGATGHKARLFVEVDGEMHDAREFFHTKKIREGSFDP